MRQNQERSDYVEEKGRRERIIDIIINVIFEVKKQYQKK